MGPAFFLSIVINLLGPGSAVAQLASASLLLPSFTKEIVAPKSTLAGENSLLGPDGDVKPKTIGFAAETMGALALENKSALGPAGIKVYLNFSRRLAAVLGIGGWNQSSTSGNVTAYSNQVNYQAMLKFGGTFYGGVGISIRTNIEGSSLLPEGGTTPYKVDGTVTATGFPFVVGFETGKKRGLFFFIETGYASYIKTDPIYREDGPLNVNVQSPAETGMVVSAGIGRYLK